MAKTIIWIDGCSSRRNGHFSEQINIMLVTLLHHFFRPDAGLHFADMSLAQQEERQTGLADAAADRERQFVIEEPLVKVQ